MSTFQRFFKPSTKNDIICQSDFLFYSSFSCWLKDIRDADKRLWISLLQPISIVFRIPTDVVNEKSNEQCHHCEGETKRKVFSVVVVENVAMSFQLELEQEKYWLKWKWALFMVSPLQHFFLVLRNSTPLSIIFADVQRPNTVAMARISFFVWKMIFLSSSLLPTFLYGKKFHQMLNGWLDKSVVC